MIDVQEFLRPIVTPFELELALTSKAWSGDYVLDFTTLLSTSSFGQDFVDPNADEIDEDGPIFSSVTGTYRHPKRYNQNGVTGERFPARDYDATRLLTSLANVN
jgi:diphthamide biosynthesis protein 2